jgi:hypothetical protein
VTLVLTDVPAAPVMVSLAVPPAESVSLQSELPPPEPITIIMAVAEMGPPGPSGSGLPWIVIPADDFDSLATKDPNVIYDVLLEELPTL